MLHFVPESAIFFNLYELSHVKNNYMPLKMLAISCLFVLISFLWQGHVGFNISDEGYLWYGAQRVTVGEVPLRDFMAYDPGRYYWVASLMSLLNDSGIITLRISIAILEVISLFVSLYLISELKRYKNSIDYLLLTLIGCIYILWMFPVFKIFDISASIFAVYLLKNLISNTTARAFFLTGFGFGVIALFGRNHALYGVIGTFGGFLYILFDNSKNISRVKIYYWFLGLMLGYLPNILMIVIVPGYFDAVVDSILFLFEIKATNLPLPVPWPWRIVSFHEPLYVLLQSLSIGFFYLLLVLFPVIAIAVILKKFRHIKVYPVLVASILVGLPYLHVAFSRAHGARLGQVIFPVLIFFLGMLFIQKNKIRAPLILLLFCVSLSAMLPYQPLWQCYISRQCLNVNVHGDNLLVDEGTAKNILLLGDLFSKYATPNQNFLVTPYWPGAYAIKNEKSPVWGIYALFPRSNDDQLDEIKRLTKTKLNFVLIANYPLDGRNELKYENTHPLVYNYILNNFERVPISGGNMLEVYIPSVNLQ